MKLKHLLAIACLSTAVIAGSTFAFPKGHGVEPAKRAEYLQKSLQLSADQQKKVQQLFEKGEQQRNALEKKYTIAEFDKFREEMHALRDTQKKELDALLTPAQREAMSIQRERHGMHGRHERGDHEWRHGDREPRDEQAPRMEQPAT